ncbi:hypothetical protein MtrunA17_Chr2g0281491 [Medicago truncatula]|uniref:Uncharacterized protein n=1 Tax=Medicago truncatula TaxID=3880 RepID=A0A396J219_MEDTR|nr:hypothetical protein MtrunA17_Chr2g0281491 [Medicago truncatula]
MPESPITADNQKCNAKKKHQLNLVNLAIIIIEHNNTYNISTT